MRPHFLLSDFTQTSRSAVGRGSFKYRRAITKHFAIPTVSPVLAHKVVAPDTQIRQHAPEDCESGRRLLVELEEGSPWQALQVFKRTGRRCRHVEDLRDLTPL